MDEFSVEPFEGIEGETEPPASVPSEAPAPQQVPSTEPAPVTSQIREFFHSQFGGISNIWPTSVCGH